MKIIKPSVEFFGAVPTDYENALAFIEQCGRLCYKSESKGEPEAFVRKLIKSGHLAMVEHSNFVVRENLERIKYIDALTCSLGKFITIDHDENYLYFGGNLTAWAQRIALIGYDPVFVPFVKQYGRLFGITSDAYSGKWEPCPYDEIPKELHRYSAKFICDRGVSHELVRHRPTAMDWYSEFVDSPIDIYKVFDGSIAQESTRYVNYAGKEMEFIEPADFDEWRADEQYIFERSCILSEGWYGKLLRNNMKPQQARAVLPNSLKTEIIVTADAAEWAHIRKLRTAPTAHPDMVRVMNMMPWEEFL